MIFDCLNIASDFFNVSSNLSKSQKLTCFWLVQTLFRLLQKFEQDIQGERWDDAKTSCRQFLNLLNDWKFSTIGRSQLEDLNDSNIPIEIIHRSEDVIDSKISIGRSQPLEDVKNSKISIGYPHKAFEAGSHALACVLWKLHGNSLHLEEEEEDEDNSDETDSEN